MEVTAEAPNKNTPIEFRFVERPGLFKISIVNWLLGLVTLGIYRFWGKTNVRKHVWSSVLVNDEPLEYTGTGGELFRGFLLVFALLFLPFIVLQAGAMIVYGPESILGTLVTVFYFLIFLVFGGYAIYKARGYQLSRTQWRGIRGHQSGSPWTFTFTYLGSYLAALFTAGWSNPAMNLALQEQLIGNMKFGDGAFRFRGPAGPLYKTYAFCWLLSLLCVVGLPLMAFIGFGVSWQSIAEMTSQLDQPGATPPSEIIYAVVAAYFAAIILFSVIIPMIWSLYSAKQISAFATYTKFDGAQFEMKTKARSIIWLVLGNLCIVLLSLGICTPFAQQRTIKFLVDRIKLLGGVDIDRISQSKEILAKRGEGLAEAFDIGAI